MEADTLAPDIKPVWFSKVWWGNMGRAFMPWKFDAERMAIWQVSSYVTLAQVAVGNIVWTWLKTSWASLIVPAFKTALIGLGILWKGVWGVVAH